MKKKEEELVQLLKDLNIFNLTLPAVKKSAELTALLDSKGISIGKIHILIAGIILVNGYNEILTNNIEHYKHIPDLKIYSY